MSKTVYVLCGVSGVGKTYLRTHDPRLKKMPYVDIAEIYEDNPGIPWIDALYMLIRQILATLEEVDKVVVEGYFLPCTVSRTILEDTMERKGITCRFKLLEANYDTCAQRIKSQVDGEIAGGIPVEVAAARSAFRLDLLSKTYRR